MVNVHNKPKARAFGFQVDSRRGAMSTVMTSCPTAGRGRAHPERYVRSGSLAFPWQAECQKYGSLECEEERFPE